MYLENIFIGSEDIRKQLPQESIMFENVHTTFSRLMKQLASIQNCLKVCKRWLILHTACVCVCVYVCVCVCVCVYVCVCVQALADLVHCLCACA